MVEGQALQRRNRRETRCRSLASSRKRSASPRKPAEAIRMAMPGYVAPFRPPGPKACPTTILTARSNVAPARGLRAANFEEIIYEGYGRAGSIIVEAATDNKNRTAAEVRSIFSKNNGNLGSAGSVSYMFHKRGRSWFYAMQLTKIASWKLPWRPGPRS